MEISLTVLSDVIFLLPQHQRASCLSKMLHVVNGLILLFNVLLKTMLSVILHKLLLLQAGRNMFGINESEVSHQMYLKNVSSADVL